MRTTIKDVAKKAQVSQATVSLVLNDGPGVSTATREAVRIVMRETNFRPDALARSLSSRRSETIALVMPPNIASLGDPYFTNLMCGVLEGVRNRGYKMLLEIADDRFMQQRLWEELFLCKRIDGLIVATPQLDHDYLSQLTVTDHPVLLINGARPDLPGIDFVGYDDLRCGREATEHLIGLGHRRIGHLCGPDNQASALARREGFVQAMEKAGASYMPGRCHAGGLLARFCPRLDANTAAAARLEASHRPVLRQRHPCSGRDAGRAGCRIERSR